MHKIQSGILAAAMNVSREDFEDYRRDQDQKMREIQQGMSDIKSLLVEMQGRHSCNRHVSSTPGESHLQNLYLPFQGVVPHPFSGRDKTKSSFVNVPRQLQKGIETYNVGTKNGEPKIDCKELDGSLVSWSNNASNTLETIVASHPGLADGLRKGMTLEAIQKLPVYINKKRSFSTDKAAVLRELKKAIPILILGRGDWTAYKLLKNKLVNNARSVAKRTADQQHKVPKRIEARGSRSKALSLHKSSSESALPEITHPRGSRSSLPSKFTAPKNNLMGSTSKQIQQTSTKTRAVRKVGRNLMATGRSPEGSCEEEEGSTEEEVCEIQEDIPSAHRRSGQRAHLAQNILQSRRSARLAPYRRPISRERRLLHAVGGAIMHQKRNRRSRPPVALDARGKKKARRGQKIFKDRESGEEQYEVDRICLEEYNDKSNHESEEYGDGDIEDPDEY